MALIIDIECWVTLCLEYKPDGIRCRCFKDRNAELRRQGKIRDIDERMLPGEKYQIKQKTFWGNTRYVTVTNEVHNPCMDITCANNYCYDHPHMYDHTGVKPCTAPNCGTLNCKRLPCEYNGNDLGLGKWPKNQNNTLKLNPNCYVFWSSNLIKTLLNHLWNPFICSGPLKVKVWPMYFVKLSILIEYHMHQTHQQ